MSSIGSQFGRNVFVLDISYSMIGIKMETLKLSTTRIIEDIPLNSYVGIVEFYQSAELCHKVVQITDRSVRDQIISCVPSVLKGGTDIGTGILFGVQALQNQNICTEDATMFLVTDGQDITNTDYVTRVLPTLLSEKIKVVCIAIGNEADSNLERLAKETNGSTYFANSTNREMMARVIESTIQEVKTSKELTESVNICVCDDIIQLNATNVTKNVTIDSDIGRNTAFTIGSEDIDKISVSIQSPNGHKYDSSSSELIRNEALKRIQLKVRNAEPGVWYIVLTKHSNQIICANFSVKSQPLNSNAIQMKVTLKDVNTNSPPIIVTEIRKGSDALIGAEVMATIDKPDGTQSQLKLINYNNIYCNYFTDYCGSGRYNVTVLAQNRTSNCSLISLTRESIVNPMIPYFERQQIAGCFKITDYMPERPANDLKLKEVSKRLSLNHLDFNVSVLNIETPAPRTAKAIIKPKVRAVPQTDNLIKAKKTINDLLFSIKKSLNSPKLSDNERTDIKKLMADIDQQMNTKTVEELDHYLKQMEELDHYLKQMEEINEKLI